MHHVWGWEIRNARFPVVSCCLLTLDVCSFLTCTVTKRKEKCPRKASLCQSGTFVNSWESLEFTGRQSSTVVNLRSEKRDTCRLWLLHMWDDTLRDPVCLCNTAPDLWRGWGWEWGCEQVLKDNLKEGKELRVYFCMFHQIAQLYLPSTKNTLSSLLLLHSSASPPPLPLSRSSPFAWNTSPISTLVTHPSPRKWLGYK